MSNSSRSQNWQGADGHCNLHHSRQKRSAGFNEHSRNYSRVFMRLIEGQERRILNIYDAQRFVTEMVNFDSKIDLLARLDDDRKFGRDRIREALSFIKTNNDVDIIFIPVLQVILNKETLQPLYEPLRNRILMVLFQIPCLLETIYNLKTVTQGSEATAATICKFLIALAKPFVEARKSKVVRKLARELKERHEIPQGKVLCAILILDELSPPLDDSVNAELIDLTMSKSQGKPICWVTDRAPPGGRHSNDQFNYRDIRIVPTIDELLCEQNPWLPLWDKSNRFIENPETYLLDSNFRLLRADAICTMKERLDDQTRVWKKCRVVGLNCHGKELLPLSFILHIDEKNFKGKTYDWRNNARVLPQHCIIALCKNGTPVRLGTITVRECNKKGEWLLAPGGAKIGVVFDLQCDFTKSMEEVAKNAPLQEKIDKLRENSISEGNVKKENDILYTPEHYVEQMILYDVVEVSQSFFSYLPILKALQELESVPLANEIAHCNPERERPQHIPSIVCMPESKPFHNFRINLDEWSTKAVVSNTSLDDSQAEALLHCLTHQVALVQGPPGTGKTFMGSLVAKIILQNTNQSILCVCYTNHALDQFLGHLLETGEQDIVRIGSRSKSEKLDRFQLSRLSKSRASLNSATTQRIKQVDAAMHTAREQIQYFCQQIEQPLGWLEPLGGAKKYLQELHPHYFKQLYILSEMELDGFTQVTSNGKFLKDDYLWKLWRDGKKCPSWLGLDEKPFFEEVWGLNKEVRHKLVDEWMQDIMSDVRAELYHSTVKYEDLCSERKALLQERDLRILRDARVIGATTNGAAQFRDILKAKEPGVVIVEEAGEVFEAHILSALSDATKQLILIGDHKQLRPKAETYKLTTVSGNGYNLDCSLFERLVLSGLPTATLNVQHRMRPSISKIIRCQTYPSLRDHPSVENRPDILGVKGNVIFINHDEKEDAQAGQWAGAHDWSQKTKSNVYEARLCVELVRYFLLQGYGSEQIVVLTPYVGQLLKIVTVMERELSDTKGYLSDLDLQVMHEDDVEKINIADTREGKANSVRCATVDNFQGEEADIVIVSLVRSNSDGKVGFLKEEQRVNVLMSRARYGLYVIGNKDTFLSSNKGKSIWGPIFEMMEVRKGLPTYCLLHPSEEPIELYEIEAFRKHRPNGGCCRPCNYRMLCGHVCPQCCHPIDPQHQAAQKRCCEPCKRFPPECFLQHPCTKLCKDVCGPCETFVGATTLPCGHSLQNSRCHDVRNAEAMQTLSDKCKEKIMYKFTACGHEEETTCSNAHSKYPICPALCSHPLKCGHLCSNRCGTCEDDAHKCNNKCERKLFCGHICGLPCHGGNCGPCNYPCEVKCIHSKCPKDCRLPCAPCVHNCGWQCEHQGSCHLICSAPCARLPCNKRCSNILSCGHRCPSVCGEYCPDELFCQICGSESIRSHIVDMIEFTAYQEHNLDHDPIVILPCGHFYSISTMDHHFMMEKVYEKKGDDFVKPKTLIAGEIDPTPRSCPDCRAIVHSIFRYGRVINFAELHSLERKHTMEMQHFIDKYSLLLEETKFEALEELISNIQKGPMHCVFEACEASIQVEVKAPPVSLLIRAMKLLSQKHIGSSKMVNDTHYKKGCTTLRQCIAICDDTKSYSSGCEVRLILSGFLLGFSSLTVDDQIKTETDELLNWIIDHPTDFKDMKRKALELKQKNHMADIKAVLRAMHVLDGYDYGGSWSSHWYQCENGHPYFIGNCGQAMEESRCIECGAAVGGSGHQLLATNRRAQGRIEELL